MSPNIIVIKPSIENCDPIKNYQQSTPIKYSLQENPILYGGGRKWLIESSNNEFFTKLGLEFTQDGLIDIFVLNTSLIIWFNQYEKGLEISYLDIPAHAVRKNENTMKLELYLQIIVSNNDEDDFLELSIRPKYNENDRYVNEQIERLFTFEYFGLNKGDKMILNTFNAIGKCSCFHTLPDQDDDVDDEEPVENVDESMELDHGYYNNSGNADDMTFGNEMVENPLGSGIMVSIYNDEVSNKTRNRDDMMEVESNKKVRA